MLFGQDGGGSHDGGLRAGGVYHGGGQGSHDGFAGTNIALQQTVHGLARLQVGADLGQGFLLGSSEGEGQRG